MPGHETVGAAVAKNIGDLVIAVTITAADWASVVVSIAGVMAIWSSVVVRGVACLQPKT